MKASTVIIIISLMLLSYGLAYLEVKNLESKRVLIFSLSQRADCDAVIHYIKEYL